MGNEKGTWIGNTLASAVGGTSEHVLSGLGTLTEKLATTCCNVALITALATPMIAHTVIKPSMAGDYIADIRGVERPSARATEASSDERSWVAREDARRDATANQETSLTV